MSTKAWKLGFQVFWKSCFCIFFIFFISKVCRCPMSAKKAKNS